MFGVVVCICVALLVYYVLHRTSRTARAVNSFPGPTEYPFIGNLFDISRQPDVIFRQCRMYAKQYSTYKRWLFHMPNVNIVTPEHAEDYFTHTKNLEKTMVYDFCQPWLGTGLLTSTGDGKWKQRRKMLTPTFHFSILRHFCNVMIEQNETLIKELEKECDSPKTDISVLINNVSLKIICETAMGTSLNLEDNRHRDYIDGVYDMCAMIMYRICAPWLYQDFIFSCTPIGRRHKRCLKILDDFTDKVVKERESKFTDFDMPDDNDMDVKKRYAMLDLLLKEKAKGNIDDAGVREEVNTFTFAGHDTSSTVLNFALLLLANHKNVQDVLFNEIQETLGNEDRKITHTDIQNMPYLDMCIKESLRLYPPVPVIARKLSEDLKIGDVAIPAEVEVLCHIFDIHRDPIHWPNPDLFDPERFLPENLKNRHPFAFVPFSAGPRNCIGQKFGMLEVKVVVSSILRNYELVPVTKMEELNLMMHIVLKNKGPIYIKFKKRTNTRVC